MKQYLLLFSSVIALSACSTDRINLDSFSSAIPNPLSWMGQAEETAMTVDAEALQNWWERFDDETLNTLITFALEDSPTRNIAEARVQEARGLRRTARSSLFPQIGISGDAGRQDTGHGHGGTLDDFYDAGFDASFEVDVFGVNRKTSSASSQQLAAAQASYHDTSLTLIAEVVRSYIDFRAAQNQYRIAEKNLESQQKTLQLINDLFRLGSAPRLDVERASNLVNTTRASLPEFKRQEANAKLQLSALTGHMPEQLLAVLDDPAAIPGSEVKPVLTSPATVMELRPDIRAAKANLLARTDLADAAWAEIFPSFSLSAFYGITDSAIINSTNVWSVAVGAAFNLLDFGRIEGNIDAANARERQAFEQYRQTVIDAVVEVETALNDYAHLNERRVALEEAYASADKALELSQTLYKEGEISFLDVLDAQRSANNAEADAVSAQAAQAESLARLFKSLGVY